MLFTAASLDELDLKILDQIMVMRAELQHQVQERPQPWTAGLRKFLTADAVASSNSIEGFRVSTQDALDIAAGERDVPVTADNRAETVAYQHLMTYVQSLATAPDFRYDKGLLNAMHWLLQGHRHSPRKVAGQWRPGMVYVTDPQQPRRAAYTAPPPEEVPGLMAELVDWLNAPDDGPPLVRAALAHLNLVRIHPWPDGNGRMSRTLQTLILARSGELAPEFSSIEAWLGSPTHTWAYYMELGKIGPTFEPTQSTQGWIRFNLAAHHQRAQAVRGDVHRSAAVWRTAQTAIERLGMDARMTAAIHETALAGRIRANRYAQAEGLSSQQAQRDLRDLVSRGILRAQGQTRARIYIPADGFPGEILDIAETPTLVHDPYQHPDLPVAPMTAL
ncbi:MAG: Fic family protein [Angustibacter sp.]